MVRLVVPLELNEVVRIALAYLNDVNPKASKTIEKALEMGKIEPHRAIAKCIVKLRQASLIRPSINP